MKGNHIDPSNGRDGRDRTARLTAPLTASARGGTYTTTEVPDGTTTFMVVDNPNDGATLSFSPDSKVRLLEDTVGPYTYTYTFKDMDADGQLDDWEDWRRSYAERAASLAQGLSIFRCNWVVSLVSGGRRRAGRRR